MKRHTLATLLPAPKILLFDWHGTLVDTHDAMYAAMDDLLRTMDQLGLDRRLTEPTNSKTQDDSKLVDYVRAHHRLHPKVVSDRKASRTDLLEVLFGSDKEAKDTANQAYNAHYRRHCGEVKPFEPGIRDLLSELRRLAVQLGVVTNRTREFLDLELESIEQGAWVGFFHSTIAGSDTDELKPSPAPILRALEDFGARPGADVWYIGDSKSDTICAKTAGITSIFFNGAQGDSEWIKAIFPETTTDPHRPDSVVDNFQDLLALVRLRLAFQAEAQVY